MKNNFPYSSPPRSTIFWCFNHFRSAFPMIQDKAWSPGKVAAGLLPAGSRAGGTWSSDHGYGRNKAQVSHAEGEAGARQLCTAPISPHCSPAACFSPSHGLHCSKPSALTPTWRKPRAALPALDKRGGSHLMQRGSECRGDVARPCWGSSSGEQQGCSSQRALKLSNRLFFSCCV